MNKKKIGPKGSELYIKYEDKKSSTFNNVLKDYILNEDCEMYRNAFNENDKRKLKKKYKSLDRC